MILIWDTWNISSRSRKKTNKKCEYESTTRILSHTFSLTGTLWSVCGISQRHIHLFSDFHQNHLVLFNTNLPWQVKGSFSSVATGKWTEIKRVWQWSSSFWMKEDWIQKQVCNENIVQVFIIDCLNCINLYMSVPYLNISVQVWEDIYPQLKRTCKTMCFHFAGTWDKMSLTFTSWSWRSLPVLAADQLLYYNQNS